MAWEHSRVAELRCARRNPFNGWSLRRASPRKDRIGVGRSFKSNSRGQSPSRDPRRVSAGQLEAGWPKGCSRETRIEAHHPVLQDETARHHATRRSLGGLTESDQGRAEDILQAWQINLFTLVE